LIRVTSTVDRTASRNCDQPQQLSSFFDQLDGDSHLSALIIDGHAPQDPSIPLDHIALRGFEDGRGVHFPMMTSNAPVRVLVTREALQGQGGALALGQYIARFKAFRDVYEAVAREKFDTDQFKAACNLCSALCF
jgi:Protein of unknown function (DUF1488)